MTTSKYDHAYGRQGGRIVPWIPKATYTPKPGERVHLNLGDDATPVIVRRVRAGGNTVEVDFVHGGWLTVPTHLLTPIEGHH